MIDHLLKYVSNSSACGSICFASGDECIIYKYDNEFIKIKQLNANLLKRHNNGGQSSVRFARLAEESRHHYITHVFDYLNTIKTSNNWIFGSSEILSMIFKRSKQLNIKLNNGGFLEFDNKTINNTQHWLNYIVITESYEKKYEEIINYLAINPDMLDFDPKKANEMKYYLFVDCDKITNNKQILLSIKSKYYQQLAPFKYIGVKFYLYDIDEN